MKSLKLDEKFLCNLVLLQKGIKTFCVLYWVPAVPGERWIEREEEVQWMDPNWNFTYFLKGQYYIHDIRQYKRWFS